MPKEGAVSTEGVLAALYTKVRRVIKLCPRNPCGISESAADKIKIAGIKPYRYEEQWNQMLCKVEGKDYEIHKLMPLFEASYKYITGIK